MTDQTRDQLDFSSDPAGGGGTLTALNITENVTPAALDDIRWATVNGGTLYVVDKGPGGASVLYRVRGPFKRGTALASVTTSVDTVNLGPGAMAGVATPLVSGLAAPKGLWYVPNPPPATARAKTRTRAARARTTISNSAHASASSSPPARSRLARHNPAGAGRVV